LHIHLIWDASAAKMPAAMRATIRYAARFYDAWFTNPITVNLAIGFNEIGGDHLDRHEGAEGRFDYVQSSYDALEPALAAQDGGAALPAADPTDGAGVYVPDAEAKALGLLRPRDAGVDGYAGFRYEPYYATDPHDRAVAGKEDFTGIALHELSEAMGRRADSNSPVGDFTVADLFRYSAPGVIGVDGVQDYFSTDGGVTKQGGLYSFGQDYYDWNYPGEGPDAYRGGITDGVLSPITAKDKHLMAALGFTEGKLPKPLPSTITRIGTSGDDVFYAHNAWGWSDSYRFYGEGGDDRFVGGSGNDVMIGGDGCDSYFNGGAGVNYYFGSDGGGPGSETGHNIFVLKDKPGKDDEDVVQDWTEGHGLVRLVDTNLHSFAQVLSHSHEAGAYLVVEPNPHHSIWLHGATAASVQASDFKFVG
jgi:hypothetical protein